MSSSKRKTIEINSDEESSPKNRRSSLAVNLSFTNFTDSGNGSLRKTHIKSNESSVQIQPYNNLLRDNKESGKNKQSDKNVAEKSTVNKTNNVSSYKDLPLKNVSVRVIDIKHVKQTDASFQQLRDAILTKTREIFNKQDECVIKTTLVLENQNNQLLNTYSKNIENQQQLSRNGITNIQTGTQNNMVSIFSTPVKNCNDNESIDKSKKSKRRLFMHNDIDYPQVVETAMKENHDIENNLRQLYLRNVNYKISPIISGSHRRRHKSRLSLKNLSKNRTKCDTDDLSQKSVSSLNILSNEIESLDTPILCSTFNEELCGNNKKFIEERGINNERSKKSATVVSMELTTVQNHSLEHYNTCNEKVDTVNAINNNQISNKKESEIQNKKEKINQTNSISDKESLMNQKTILVTSNTLLQSSQFITEKDESIKTTVNNENSVEELESSLHVNTSMDNANEEENVAKVHGSLQVNTSLNSTYKHRQSHNKEQSKQRSTRTSEKHSRRNNETTNENSDSSNYIQCTPYDAVQSNFPKSLSQMDTVIHNTKLKDSSKMIETLNNSNKKKIDETVLSPKTEPCACKIHTTILCTKNKKDILRSTVILDDSPFIASNKLKCKEVIIDESLSQQVTGKDKIKNNSLKNVNVIPPKIKKKKLLPLTEDSKLSFTPMEKSSSPTPLITKKKKQFKKKRTMKQNLWTKQCNVPNDAEKSNNDLSENNFSFDLKKKKERKHPRKVVSKKIVIKKMVDSDIVRKLENLYKPSDQKTEIIENENSMNEFQIKKRSSQRSFHKSPKIIMVITGFSKGDKHLIKNIVKSLGMASIEQNVTRRTTHVVSTGVRTVNLLHGIIRGCWLVNLEWVLKSLENNEWLNPEDYEMMHYSKAVKENRKDRELFGMAYVPDLFATSGFLHVENGTTPSAQVLKELIKAAGGRITEYPQAAKIIIGANGVKESWILDSITTGVLQSTAQYQRNDILILIVRTTMEIITNESIPHSTYQPPSPDLCIPIHKSNTTIITDLYAGIPENLVLNLIGFVLLVILFGLLRKKAWNYGRLALLHKSDNKWMELFYGDNDTRDSDAIFLDTSVNSQLSQVDRGFLSWIVTAFKIKDEELLKRAGPDGLLYILFERYLIVLTIGMVIVSLCIALPINIHGNKHDNDLTFSRTTIGNLDPMSSWIWVHSILIISYLPIGAYVMRRFLKQVRETRSSGELAARTLIITEIPKHQCDVETLTEYFKEAFSTLSIEDVTLAYDIRRLSTLDAERDCAEQARLYCENYAKKRDPLKIYPYRCGQVLGCCCKSKVDAQEFYTNEEIRLTALVEEEKKLALSKPLGIAFVTLGTPGAARTMRRQLRSLPSIKWVINYAPAPSDIFWENLSIPKRFWYFNAILINFALGITLFFLTTPAVIIPILNRLTIPGEITKNLNPVISSFLPTLLLVSVAALMPVLVEKSESLVRHWTRSSLNRTVMKKTLLLLLLMVLILPSLGLTSAEAFFVWTMKAKNETGRWDCVFLPDQGALFVNYVITAALLGSALELVRFPELALYTFRLCVARSKAERVYVRKAVLWEFPLGAHYAWLLLVFTMTTVYSLACPLITPFGLLYLLVKHLVDRHNLCFAYGPNVGGGQLAGAAASAAGAAPILAQVAFLSLGLVRRGLSPLAAVQLSGLAASILGLVTGVTLPASKPKTQPPKRDLPGGVTGQSFIAPVLKKKTNSVEETISINSNLDINLASPRSTTSSIQESPKLYQNYGKEPKV